MYNMKYTHIYIGAYIYIIKLYTCEYLINYVKINIYDYYIA